MSFLRRRAERSRAARRCGLSGARLLRWASTSDRGHDVGGHPTLPVEGPMTDSLRARLIGAWKLVSYVETPVDGSEPFEPLGHEPNGIIMYPPDGYMSAQLSKPDRPDFASGDWFTGTPEDYQAEASTYIAYSGPFHVDEAGQTLTHSMFVSLF